MRRLLETPVAGRCLLAGAALVLALGLHAPLAAAFSGSLISTDLGILGTGNWIVTGPTSLCWEVTPNPDLSWHYTYLFSHPVGETSHFILETSRSFTLADLLNPTGDFGSISVGWQKAGPGNPNIPEAVYGIKFDEASGLETHLAFDSFRAPVWGDFFAKDGAAGDDPEMNTAWNAGFTSGDVDPQAAPQNGSVDYHVLVPDTQGPPPVPEPATLLLVGTALLGLVVVRRRRSL